MELKVLVRVKKFPLALQLLQMDLRLDLLHQVPEAPLERHLFQLVVDASAVLLVHIAFPQARLLPGLRLGLGKLRQPALPIPVLRYVARFHRL